MQPRRNDDGTWSLGDLLMNDAGHGRVTLRDCGSLLLAADGPGGGGEGEPTEDPECLVRPFRMLSATLIEGYWVDFSDPQLFKSAVKLFDGVTIFRDHRPDIACWVGVAVNARYSERAGAPPGIDADYRINKAQDQALTQGAIIRGLSSSPPAIRCTSVGIAFKSRRSHPDMSGFEFWMNLGKEVNGEVVRFVVEKLKRVYETSLVYSGADPNARAFAAPRSHEMKDMKELAAALQAKAAQDPELAAFAKAALSMAGAESESAAQLEQEKAERVRLAAELEAKKVEDLVKEGKAANKICGPAHEQAVRQNYKTSEDLQRFLATAKPAGALDPLAPAVGGQLAADNGWAAKVNRVIEQNQLGIPKVAAVEFAQHRAESEATLRQIHPMDFGS